MGVNVFANGMEVAAKKSDDQSIAAMPDVCLSPPSPPAGPVPIPYPNFSKASDTTDGTKTVKLGGQESGIKNESSYSTSKGDEAATRSLGMGTVTHTIQGKTKFAAWSMDVKFEGSNVPRFGDITTHNHANMANSAATAVSAGGADQAAAPTIDCKELNKARRAAEKADLEEPVQPGQTHALGKFEGPDASKTLKGVSHDSMVKSGATSGYSTGKDWPMEEVEYKSKAKKTKGKTKKKLQRAKGPMYMACGKNKQEHDAASVRHAESRMIEDLISDAKGAGVAMPPGPVGSLALSIKWKPSEGGQSNMPCSQCKKLACEAQACGLDITICDGSKPRKPNCSPTGEWKGLRP